MSYAIDLPPPLQALMETFSFRTRVAISATLDRMARRAEVWAPEDTRWEHLARHEGEGLCFYADGCCVRVELRPKARRLVVREIGRVLVHIPAERCGAEAGRLGFSS